MSRPFRVPTKSRLRRFFQDNARLMRAAYGYDDEEVNRVLAEGRQLEGGAIEAIRAWEEVQVDA